VFLWDVFGTHVDTHAQHECPELFAKRIIRKARGLATMLSPGFPSCLLFEPRQLGTQCSTPNLEDLAL